jgi:arginine decarboxylase-like protein
MSQKEIDKKVRKLSSAMSISEMIEYIKYSNEQIENNYKESEMANQVNKKFINSLYRITFGRLKTKNATNKDFIDFAKALTGR